MRKPQLAKALEKKASELFHRTKGITLRPEYEGYMEQIVLMETTYGRFDVMSDFEKWAGEVDKNEVRFPVTEYLKIVDERLGSNAVYKDEEVAEVTKNVYNAVQDIPKPHHIRLLLEKYPVEDIVMGFNEFLGGIDAKLKGSEIITKYFVDGGADAVIKSLYEQSEKASE